MPQSSLNQILSINLKLHQVFVNVHIILLVEIFCLHGCAWTSEMGVSWRFRRWFKTHLPTYWCGPIRASELISAGWSAASRSRYPKQIFFLFFFHLVALRQKRGYLFKIKKKKKNTGLWQKLPSLCHEDILFEFNWQVMH